MFDETLGAAVAFAEETGAVFIPPFDHNDIIAGQGTLGLEILEQRPDVDTILVAVSCTGVEASGVDVVLGPGELVDAWRGHPAGREPDGASGPRRG